MEILVVTVFISLVLVAGALIFLFARAREGDFDHGDRLSLLPLEGDEGPLSPDDEASSEAETQNPKKGPHR